MIPFNTWTDPRCDFIRLGLTGLVIRRNLLFMLIGLEIMINASALAFVVAGSYWGQTDGQVMYILAISLAAAEAKYWTCAVAATPSPSPEPEHRFSK